MLWQIEDLLKEKDVEYEKRRSLRSFSSIKIGGKAELVIFPKSDEDLITSVDMLRRANIPYRVFGRMSNLLLPDGDLSLAVIKTDRFSKLSFDGAVISASAGVNLPLLSSLCSGAGLSGLEELSGIPGSLGGAIYGNAGAFGREICELILAVRVYIPRENRVVRLSANELWFSYRKSSFTGSDHLILSAELSLKSADPTSVKEKVREYREIRKANAPCEPSLGSVFKRPKSGYASKMIDESGLRGFRIGGAEISRVHAGYIVNLGTATSSDVKSLVSLAEKRVMENFGVRLEREIEYI